MPTDKTFDLPAKALFQIVLDTGHVHSKADFAKLAGISVGNVYNYLPSNRGTRRTAPFQATLGTIRKWVDELRQKTGLHIQIVIPDGGGVEFGVDGLTASGQNLSPPVWYRVETPVSLDPVAPTD